jgi:hypothetical protein
MKFILSVILTALLAYAFGLYLPWWSVVPAAFLVALCIVQKPGWSLLSGFLGAALLWGIMAAWISSANQGVLAQKMSALILKKDQPVLLMLLTALVGGLPAGMAACSASLLRSILGRKPVSA